MNDLNLHFTLRLLDQTNWVDKNDKCVSNLVYIYNIKSIMVQLIMGIFQDGLNE